MVEEIRNLGCEVEGHAIGNGNHLQNTEVLRVQALVFKAVRQRVPKVSRLRNRKCRRVEGIEYALPSGHMMRIAHQVRQSAKHSRVRWIRSRKQRGKVRELYI